MINTHFEAMTALNNIIDWLDPEFNDVQMSHFDAVISLQEIVDWLEDKKDKDARLVRIVLEATISRLDSSSILESLKSTRDTLGAM